MVKTLDVLENWIASAEVTEGKEKELEEARKKMDAFLATEFDDQKQLGAEAEQCAKQLAELHNSISEVQGRTAQSRIVEVFKLVFKSMRSRTHVVASGDIGGNKVFVTIGKNGFGTRKYGSARSRDVDWIADINIVASMRPMVAKGLVDLKMFDEARKFNRFCENMPHMEEGGHIPTSWTIDISNIRFASRYGLPRKYDRIELAPIGYREDYGMKFMFVDEKANEKAKPNNDSLSFRDISERPHNAMVYAQVREAVLAKIEELKKEVPLQCADAKEKMRKFEDAFSRELMLEAL